MHKEIDGHRKLTKCSCHRTSKAHRSIDPNPTTKRIEVLANRRLQLRQAGLVN